MKLAAFKGVRSAGVWKAGVLAAHLTRDDAGTMFEYDPAYDGPPVATTLPRGDGPIRLVAGALPPFFSGLLPEGRRLTAIRRAVKTSADDELTLLLAVGRDTVGDIQVLPVGETPDSQPDHRAPEPLTDVVFAELFERVLGPDAADRVALPGVQDKVSGRMISVPIATASAAWFLKLNPPEYPDLVENEAFFLSAARDSGLDVAKAEVIHDRTGAAGLLVHRFDRLLVDNILRSVPQEDACQVLRRYPADKYLLSTEEVIQGLAARTGAPIVAARNLIQQFAFAYLTCNGDAHAKNFSILHRDGEWRVTPAYDLPSSHPYGDTTMALNLGGKNREDIGRADFIALGEACAVPPKATARVLDELLAAAPRWLDRLAELPFGDRRAYKLGRACRYRADRLAG